MTQMTNLFAAALAELRAAEGAMARCAGLLEQAREMAVKGRVYGLPDTTAPASEHRRQHRPGRPPKIDSDPELQAFIAARVDRLTFHQIADDVAQHFPPARQVRKSAIYAWWRKTNDTRSGKRR